jgi:hypothetical protein
VTRATPRAPKAPQAPPTAPTEPVPGPPPPSVPVVDPLADLREPGPDLPPVVGDAQPEVTEDQETEPESGALVTQEDWDRKRDLAVVAMHADTTTLGFLHKGGRCGCHYIAGVILHAIMPVEPEPEPEPGPLDELAGEMAHLGGRLGTEA